MTAGSTTITFILNGSPVEAVVRNDETLLELLRGEFGLHGARESCGQGSAERARSRSAGCLSRLACTGRCS